MNTEKAQTENTVADLLRLPIIPETTEAQKEREQLAEYVETREMLFGVFDQLLRMDAGEAPEPPVWLIRGLLDAAPLSVFFGEFHSAKSYVSIDISLSLATGEDALTLYSVDDPIRVLYVSSEGTWNLHNRVRAWVQQRAGGDQLKSHRLAKLIGENFRVFGTRDDNGRPRAFALDLTKADDQALRLIRSMANYEALDFVVVDVVADVASGVEENSSGWGDIFRRLRDDIVVPVLAVHHMGKNPGAGMRGHTSAPAAADNAIRVSSSVEQWEENGVTPKVTSVLLEDHPEHAKGTKRREGQYFGKIGLRLATPEGFSMPEGWKAPGAIIGPSAAHVSRVLGSDDLDEKSLQALRLVYEAGEGGIATPEVEKALGLSKGTGSRRMKKLLPEDDGGEARKAYVSRTKESTAAPYVFKLAPKGREVCLAMGWGNE